MSNQKDTPTDEQLIWNLLYYRGDHPVLKAVADHVRKTLKVTREREVTDTEEQLARV
jgi:hypothetical protein